MSLSEFSAYVCEQIGYYVYCLKDPGSGEVFYIGKGCGNRVFDHVNETLTATEAKHAKYDRINAIRAAGKEVAYQILRHGLTEKEAFEIEATLIDIHGLNNLSNKVQGHHAEGRGLMRPVDIVAKYEAKHINVTEPALMIILNRGQIRTFSEEELYEQTRGDWVLGPRRITAQYALAVFNSVVRQVFRIKDWEKIIVTGRNCESQERWRFTGDIASELSHYLGGRISSKHFKKGAKNPIRYFNCSES